MADVVLAVLHHGTSHGSPALFLLALPPDSIMCALYAFQHSIMVLGCSEVDFSPFFSFLFQFRDFLLTYLQVDRLPLTVVLTNLPAEGHFHLCHTFVSHVSFSFFQEFASLCSRHP